MKLSPHFETLLIKRMWETDFSERSKAAYRDNDFKNNPSGYTVAPYVNDETTSAAFEAGADYWHARARCLEEALETYAMTNETFPEYGDVAREALARYRDGAE